MSQKFGYFFCFFEIIVVLIDADDEQGIVSIASSEDDIIVVGGHIDQSGTGSTDLPAQGTVQLLLSKVWEYLELSCHLPILSAVVLQRR